jgi:predicted dehydrogenase
MFLPGQPAVLEPPLNDMWTIPGEEQQLSAFNAADRSEFLTTSDPVEYYVRRQNRDFIVAVANNKAPLVTANEGRRTVALFTAIYRSTKERQPVRWPL